jgi:serine protease Do
MKQIMMKRLLIAGIAFVTVPTTLLAQKEKEKEKDKEQRQHIVITRSGDLDVKTVIEINGDKIKVNGKDVKDLKDVQVNIATTTNSNTFRYKSPGAYNIYSDPVSLFSEDENRAMLGVVTEGNEKGAEIQSITKESAAEKAGLKKGDVITKIGDCKIESTDDVTEAVRRHKPGDKVGVIYLRDGKELKTNAELGKWKGIKMNAVSVPRIADMGQWEAEPQIYGSGNWSVSGRPKLGLSIQDTEDGVGVIVLDVEDESNAEKAGLRKDDIIVGIDDKEVKSTEDITRNMRQVKDKYTYIFRVKRGGKTENIEVKIPRKLKTAEL